MSTNQITTAGRSLLDGLHLDLDPPDGTAHYIVAVTGPGSEVVPVRLWGPEVERTDWKRAVG